MRIHLPRARLHRVCDKLLHLWDDLLDDVTLDIHAVQILLELRVR